MAPSITILPNSVDDHERPHPIRRRRKRPSRDTFPYPASGDYNNNWPQVNSNENQDQSLPSGTLMFGTHRHNRDHHLTPNYDYDERMRSHDHSHIGHYPISRNEHTEQNVTTEEPGVVVRGEEIGIVVVVLLLWVGAIILFFNRWGKIRMLEPYQPKFCESHRPSCPMADVTGLPHCPRSYSKFNLSTDVLGSPHFAKCNYHGIPTGVTSGVGIGSAGRQESLLSAGSATGPYNYNHASTSRPRQNSVFVTSPHSSIAINGSILKSSSRKTKSAFDLSTLVLTEEFMDNVRRNSKNSITQL